MSSHVTFVSNQKPSAGAMDTLLMKSSSCQYLGTVLVQRSLRGWKAVRYLHLAEHGLTVVAVENRVRA